MRPYGERVNGGHTHDADKCDVCGSTTGRGRHNKRQKSRERQRAQGFIVSEYVDWYVWGRSYGENICNRFDEAAQ